ncbi:hypothetical protein HUN59_05320 [Curtobacterium sp. Csp2]|uniref:hypothetical protein n=1 Tax=Curtobacterium sp. Csp2 TaxID=2495430 RepID=UPI00157FE983|nr:hypothetical protein [Curtobacterium sp. Csp2]QKS15717.1 hypothetical protein HUN59_05320 [Curtobacterium sp. Csp2]
MTDPVDTDALRERADALLGPMPMAQLDRAYASLRAAADEVDQLRAELAISENRAGGYEEVVAGLRAAIEDAPHDSSCWLVDPQSTWTKNERDCTCWKADAL